MFGANTFNSLYDAALAFAYPQACAVCRGSVESRFDGVACGGCWDETRLFTEMDSLCWKCGALAIVTVSAAGREAVRCRACDESAYDAARACGIYQGALRAAVLELKRKPHVPRRLLQLISKTQERSPLDRSTLIVPVPLHPAREQERGFNQAVILARALARVTRLPVVENCLVRIAQTARHRAGMDAKARRESVTGAFAIVAPQLITAESVLLVDDVFTSGATISSCALALRSAGAREVLGVTLARPLTP